MPGQPLKGRWTPFFVLTFGALLVVVVMAVAIPSREPLPASMQSARPSTTARLSATTNSSAHELDSPDAPAESDDESNEAPEPRVTSKRDLASPAREDESAPSTAPADPAARAVRGGVARGFGVVLDSDASDAIENEEE